MRDEPEGAVRLVDEAMQHDDPPGYLGPAR